jgi:hypothetical protein
MNKDGLAWRSKAQSVTIIGNDLKKTEWMRLNKQAFQVCNDWLGEGSDEEAALLNDGCY